MNFERRAKPEDSKQSFHGAGGARGVRRRLYGASVAAYLLGMISGGT